jgi:hypothetical protein
MNGSAQGTSPITVVIVLSPRRRLSPSYFIIVLISGHTPPPTRRLDLIARGGAACILMAGGAGTRLGFAQPKGMYGMKLDALCYYDPWKIFCAVVFFFPTAFILCACQILACRHTRPYFKSKPNDV